MIRTAYLRVLPLLISFLLLPKSVESQSLSELYTSLSNANHDSVRIEIYGDMVFSYSRANMDSCRHYASLLESTATAISHKEAIARSGFYHAVCEKNAGNNKLALDLLATPVKYYQEVGDSNRLASMLYQVMMCHYNLSDQINFLQTANRGIKIHSDNNNQRMVAMTLGVKGNFYKNRNNFEKANEQSSEALAIYETIGDSSGMADILNGLGVAAIMQNQYDIGISYFQRQHAINLAQNNRWGMGFSHGNLGQAYQKKGDLTKAAFHIEKAIDIRNELGNTNNIGASMVHLAELKWRLKNTNQAKKIAFEALSMFIENDTKVLQKTAYDLLSQIEESSGNYKQSLHFHKKLLSTIDSLSNDNLNNKVAELETAFETEKKEAEIERLSFADQLNEERIVRQRWALGGLGIGIGLLSFLLFRLFGQNKKIKTQNQIITKSHHDKAVLLKEIHHRVKNNLQVISSLLGLQSISIENKKAKDAIQESRSRVHSMSLIHQNLYKKDNPTGIEMAPYIEKLCQDLIQTYSIGETDIVLDQNVQSELILDVETVVPIGLIINELLTNSLKYAFPEKEKGQIAIKLTEVSDQLVLVVSDDGVGFDNDTSDSEKESFGHTLIRAFRDKLGAETEISGVNGTTVTLKMDHYLKV